MKKADVLFLLVGTNPIPNIISILNRVKEDGVIYFLHTKGSVGDGTEDIAEKLKDVSSQKKRDLKIILQAIPSSDDIEIEKKISGITDYILNSAEVIELNYTGGTKVMSATSYNAFKKLACKNSDKIFNLTYLDNEKNLFIAEVFNKGACEIKQISLKDIKLTNRISIEEIAKIHCVGIEFKKVQVINEKACRAIFDSVKNPDTSKHTIELLGRYYDKVNKVKLKSESAFIKLKENHDPFNEIYQIMNVPMEFKNLGFNDEFREIDAIKYFKGDWLEDYMSYLFNKNKEKWKIDEIAHSVTNDKPTEDEKKFEVDLVLLKNNTTYFLSVSSVDGHDSALKKLYEVMYRAAQLSGNSGKVGCICFYKDSAEIENNYMRFWEKQRKKSYMVVQLDKLMNLEEEIEQWIS